MINWTTVMSVLLAIAMAALAPIVVALVPIVLVGAIALVWFIVSIPYLITKKLKDKDK